MVRIFSSFLIFFLILPYAIQLLDLSCQNVRRKQFFELFEPRLQSFSTRKIGPSFYHRPLLVPSAQEPDDINATTEHCGTSLLDNNPLPTTLSPELKIDSNVTEDVSIPISNLSENTPPENQPPIVPFEEWTKQKLEQEKLKHHSVTNGNQNVDHLTPPIDKKVAAAASTIETVSIEEKVQTTRAIHTIPLVVSKRNYASKECGAKVIGANDEAEKYGAILNDKEKDEYMRNACEKAKEKYVVIELCETIQPKSIELANFELFSSSPKTFRILASERQSPMEWITLGEFEGQDTRDVQTFQIPEHSTYTKFIRLELLTHYGREHYCTLSSFRVYGISMVDEYEAEAASFDVVENAGAPFKITTSETLATDLPLPIEEALVTPPVSPEVTEPPIEATLATPPIEIVEPQIMLPLAPWQIRDCQKCDSKHPKAVTAWLCYVFSPSICSQRKTPASKNITFTLSKGQIKFLRNVLQPSSTMCSLQNITVEKRSEVMKTTSIPPTKQEPTLTQHIIETEVKKQTIIQHKQTSNVPLPAGTTSHKESVFLKLNKRLTLLEMNISLSSQYLTELSRQYVAQTEENKKNYEKTSKYIEEAISRASLTLSKQFGDQIFEIKKDFKDLLARFHSHPSNIIPGRYGHESGSLIIRHPTAKGHCRSAEYDNIYLDESDRDGLWTTQQLVVVIAVMQATTFGMIFVLQYLWKSSAQASQKVILISSDIDVKSIIAAEVQNELKLQHEKMQQHLAMTATTALVLPNTSSSSNPSPLIATTASPSKKQKKKKKRNGNSNNAFNIPTNEKWDSASTSSNISAPSSSNCSSTLTSISLKKKDSTASRDSCFTSESIENVPPIPHSCFPIS